jgi:hypothetical protein
MMAVHYPDDRPDVWIWHEADLPARPPCGRYRVSKPHSAEPIYEYASLVRRPSKAMIVGSIAVRDAMTASPTTER